MPCPQEYQFTFWRNGFYRFLRWSLISLLHEAMAGDVFFEKGIFWWQSTVCGFSSAYRAFERPRCSRWHVQILTRLLIRIQSKLVRKTREHTNDTRTQNITGVSNRRQHAGSQTLFQNGEVKRKHTLARFWCQLYSKWIYDSLFTLLPGTFLETKSLYSHFSSVDDNNGWLVEIIEACRRYEQAG